MRLLTGYPNPSHYSGADNTLSQNNVTAVVQFLLARFMLTGAFGYQAQDIRVLYGIAHLPLVTPRSLAGCTLIRQALLFVSLSY